MCHLDFGSKLRIWLPRLIGIIVFSRHISVCFSVSEDFLMKPSFERLVVQIRLVVAIRLILVNVDDLGEHLGEKLFKFLANRPEDAVTKLIWVLGGKLREVSDEGPMRSGLAIATSRYRS